MPPILLAAYAICMQHVELVLATVPQQYTFESGYEVCEKIVPYVDSKQQQALENQTANDQATLKAALAEMGKK